jgi:uncharacterized protein (TIGR00106 family)
MSTMVEFSVVPMGRGASVSPIIAEVMKIVVASGVSYRANPMGTVLEGEWDQVMSVVKACHHLVMQNADRVITTIKVDDRKGTGPRMDQKLASVEEKLGKKLAV